MSYTHEWGDDGLYIKHIGKLTSYDLIHSNSDMIGRREYEMIKYMIVDFTRVSEIEISGSDVDISTSYAVNVNSLNNTVKVAFISSNKELRVFIDMYIKEALSKLPYGLQKLFINKMEAEAWINA